MRESDRVFIVGNHPWSGFSGVIVGEMLTPVGKMWSVLLDNGMRAGASKEHLQLAQQQARAKGGRRCRS